jgi:hypothetical protein
MAWHDRIQATQQLRRRTWDGSKDCKFCLKEEYADHLLFKCPIAVAAGSETAPSSVKSFHDIINNSGGDSRGLF